MLLEVNIWLDSNSPTQTSCGRWGGEGMLDCWGGGRMLGGFIFLKEFSSSARMISDGFEPKHQMENETTKGAAVRFEPDTMKFL